MKAQREKPKGPPLKRRHAANAPRKRFGEMFVPESDAANKGLRGHFQPRNNP